MKNFTCVNADYESIKKETFERLKTEGQKHIYSKHIESDANKFFAAELRRFADAIDRGYPYVMSAMTRNTSNTILEIDVRLSCPWGG